MSLRDYRPESASITYKGGSFDVRGLTLDDVSTLIRTHMSDLDAVFEMYKRAGNDVFATANAERFILNLAKDAPALTANVIALASGESSEGDTGELVAAARALSLPLQVQALQEIGRLTFEDAGGPKNFFATLMNLLGGVMPPVKMPAGSPKKINRKVR